jgi:hypothetical protein
MASENGAESMQKFAEIYRKSGLDALKNVRFLKLDFEGKNEHFHVLQFPTMNQHSSSSLP